MKNLWWTVLTTCLAFAQVGHGQTFNSTDPELNPKDECAFIRDALRALPSSGGEVVIPEGTYTCATAIVIDQNNVTLRGQGQVLLKLADGANSPNIVMGDLNTPPKALKNIEVRDLNLDGNRTTMTWECWGGPCDSGGLKAIRNNGVTIRGVTNGRIKNMFIRSPRSGGVVSEHHCYEMLVDGLTVTDSQFDGFAGYVTYRSLVQNLFFFDNMAAGISIDIDFSDNVIRNAHILNNRDVGVFMRDSHRNLFENIKIENAGNHGVFAAIVEWPETCPVGNEFRDLQVIGSKGHGFVLAKGADAAKQTSCMGNRLTGTTLFKGNRGMCIDEAEPQRLVQEGSMICEP